MSLKSLFMFSFIPEPTDRPPMLLIANSETIEVFYLNGSKMATLTSVNGNEIHTLDFIYNEDMICWIESRESSNQLKCIQITKTGRLTDEWTINILQSFYSKCFNSYYMPSFNDFFYRLVERILRFSSITYGDGELYMQVWMHLNICTTCFAYTHTYMYSFTVSISSAMHR